MIARWKKGLALAMGGLVLLVLLGMGGVYGVSSLKLTERYDVGVSAPGVSAASGDAVRGARLARIVGCRSCHGDGLEGRIFGESPMFGRVIAPNLTRVRETYSDADLVRLLRHGVRPDGTGVLIAMPVQMFTNLSDDDLAAIVAFIRSVPSVPTSLPATKLALPARALIAAGMVDMVPEMIDHDAPAPPTTSHDDPIALGSYLAHVACTECHGPDLRGGTGGFQARHLGVAAGYRLEDFRHFLRTGEALGGRELGTMSGVARGRFSSFTDREIEALHAYLKTLVS